MAFHGDYISRMKPFIEIFKSLSDHAFKNLAIYQGKFRLSSEIQSTDFVEVLKWV